MKKNLLAILFALYSCAVFSQTYDILPHGYKPAGNQTYVNAEGKIIVGDSRNGFRVLMDKQAIDTQLGTKQFKYSITPEEFGAKGDGVTDDTFAIQACFNAVPVTGGRVTFSNKRYKITGSLVINNKTSLVGTNGNMQRDYAEPGFPYDNIGTILETNSLTSTLLLINAKACDIQNIQLKNTASAIPTDGSGIHFTNAGGFRLSNISVFGFNVNINIEKGVLWKIEGAFLSSPALYNIKISTIPSFSDFGDGKISNSWLVANNNTSTNLRYESSSGLSISNVKFISSGTARLKYHIDINNNVPLSDLIITGCSFESFSGSAIKIRPVGTGFVQELQIINNQFAPFADISDPVINILGRPTANNLNVMVNNNTFYNSNAQNNSNARLPVRIDSAYSVSVSNNNYFGWNNRLLVTNSNDVDTLTNFKNRALLNRTQTWSAPQSFSADVNLGGNVLANNGTLQIGPTSFTGASIVNSRNLTGATSVVGFRNAGQIQSDVTVSAVYNSVRASTQASNFTVPSLFYHHAAQGVFGANSKVTNQYAFFVDPSLIGATNNFGYYGGIPYGAGRWNFYISGDADNYIKGKLGIGLSIPTEMLDILGNVKASGSVTSAQFKVSSLQTAPASATAPGSAGEIRFTAAGIFICIATNSWIKAVGNTF